MSTLTTNKGYIKQAHNEDVDSWDVPLNNTFDIIDKNLGGLLTVPVSNVNVTLNATQAQNLMFSITGVLTGNVVIVYPAVGGIFSVSNNTSGAFSVTIANPSGPTLNAPQGQSILVLSTGTGLFQPNPLVSPTMLTTGGPSWDGAGNLTLPVGAGMTIRSTSPTITLQDTDNVTRYLHCNSNLVGFLTSTFGWACYTDNSGNFVATGNVSAFSDIRTKSDLKPIYDAMAIVRQMRGYFYTDNASGEKRVGLVAQDLVKALPEVVGEGPDGLLHVAYGNVSAVLAEGLKQLDERIERLEQLVGLLG